MEVPIGNRHLNKNIFETFGLDPNDQTFYDSGSDDDGAAGFEEAEQVDISEEPTSPIWRPDVGALRPHHTVIINYPSLNLLDDPAEEFIMNKPKSPEERYAPHPLVLDEEVMKHAARDKITDNGFYSVYRCDQPTPDPSVRDFSTCDLFVDVEEATKCHGRTELSVILFRDTSKPEIGPQLRIRRSTRFIWGDIIDYNERDYDLALKDFMSYKAVKPAWYQDLVHLMGIESDRAARFIALKLEHYATTGTPRKDLHDIHLKFIKSFGAEPRWIEDFDSALRDIIEPHKTPLYKAAPKCMACRQKCERYVSLACSKDHIIHGACLMELCRTRDTTKVACLVCKTRVFTNPIHINCLKFNIHDDNLFYNDDRYNPWENFEKSCSDLDSTSAATNDFRIVVTRDFMTSLWCKIVNSGIEPNIPKHLRFDVPEEAFLLQSLVDGQFLHLEGVRTTIASIDRWVKRRVFIRFRREFLKSNLEQGLRLDDRKLIHHHDMMRKVLRRGWYDQYLKNLNRLLNFLSMRVCLCREGEESVYHWHAHREFYNPRVVEREQRDVTEERRKIYKWQNSEAGQNMMRLFLIEVDKMDEETKKRESKRRRVVDRDGNPV